MVYFHRAIRMIYMTRIALQIPQETLKIYKN